MNINRPNMGGMGSNPRFANPQPQPKMRSNKGAEDILQNFIDSADKDNKHYNTMLKSAALFTVTHFVGKEVNKSIAKSNTSARGFNKYWKIVLSELMTLISAGQKALLVKEFGMAMINHINESTDLIIDPNDSDEAEFNAVETLFANKSNLIEFSNGVEMGSLNNDVPEVERFLFSLKYHKNKTSNITEFIDSVRNYIEVYKESSFTDFDLEMLTIHYERYA